MFKLLFDGLINILATVLQIIVLPVNIIIQNNFPDFSEKITQVTETLNTVFDCITWALGLIPPQVTAVLLFIISVEIAKHTIYKSTHALIKVWNVLQKVKFW